MATLGRRGFAGALLFWIMPAAATAGGLALAPLITLCALIGAPWRSPKRVPRLAWLVFAAAAWTALSILWAPPIVRGPDQALKVILTTLSGLGFAAGLAKLDAQARGWVRASLLAGLLMLAFLLTIEAVFDMPFNRGAQPDAITGLLQRNPGRGVLVMELLGFIGLAAALTLRSPARWIVAGVLLVSMAWLSPQFAFDANIAAFVVGVLMFALGYAAPKLGPALVGWFWAGWLMLAPWVTAALSQNIRAFALEAPPSWGQRLMIWNFAAARIREKPLFGWGLDASRTFIDPQQLGRHSFPAIPLHPHSFSLHVWLETGLVGAVLFAAAFAVAGAACARWCAGARLPAAAATACFASLGMVWNVSYGAWQEWYMALPFIAAAALLTLHRPEAPKA
jgi:O-antigen ligase